MDHKLIFCPVAVRIQNKHNLIVMILPSKLFMAMCSGSRCSLQTTVLPETESGGAALW